MGLFFAPQCFANIYLSSIKYQQALCNRSHKIASATTILQWHEGQCHLPRPGPVFCLLLGVNAHDAKPITSQVIIVTCPAIGRVQPELTPRKRQKTGPVLYISSECKNMCMLKWREVCVLDLWFKWVTFIIATTGPDYWVSVVPTMSHDMNSLFSLTRMQAELSIKFLPQGIHSGTNHAYYRLYRHGHMYSNHHST